MALSLALMIVLHSMVGEFNKCYSQVDEGGQEKVSRSSINPCSNRTCKVWTEDIVDCSYVRCRFIRGSIPDTVKILIMTSVGTELFDYHRMKQLAYLDLGNCSINIIVPEKNAFYNLPSLKFLNFSNNRVDWLLSDAFTNTTQLTHIDLSNCRLQLIEKDAFINLTHLEVLNLSMNFLVYDTPDFFISPLVNLKTYKLPSYRGCWKFLMDTLVNLTKLEILWFGQNQFSEFPTFPTKTSNIKELSLENSYIFSLPVGRWLDERLGSLETLILSGNRLEIFEPRAFTPHSKLSRLDLDRNNFLMFYLWVFTLQSLKKLSLNSATIMFILGRHENVSNLEELHLDNAKGIFDAFYPFNFLGNLIHLNAKGNGIRSERIENMTRHLPKLRYLDLGNNEINTLERIMFHNLNLEALLLNDNLLSSMSIVSLPLPMWSSLKIIGLSDNSFQCDCEIAWFRYWLNNHWGNGTALNKDQVKCWSPKNVKGTPVAHLQYPTDIDCFSTGLDGYLTTVFAVVFLLSFAASSVSCLHRFRWQLKYYYFMQMSKRKTHGEPEDHNSYSYDAFICYAEADRRWVLDFFCMRLESDFELKLCIQDRDWSFGEEILKNFAFSVENSRKTVLMLSNAFAVSPWTHFEMTVAQTKFIEDNCDNLVLVLMEEIAVCNMNPMISLQLQQRNHIEWTQHAVGQKLFWDKLKQALARPSASLLDAIPPRDLFHSIEA